jgi:hypothetical protein
MLCAVAGGGGFSAVVDIFNVSSGYWSTAALSVARSSLAATSLPNHAVAIFAGGKSTCYCCYVIFVSLRVACFVKGMLELFLMCVHISCSLQLLRSLTLLTSST